MTKVEIEVPFWGFYESIHDSFINDAIESAFNYDYETGNDKELPDDFWDDVMSADFNWADIQKAYSKAYVEAFGEKFGLDLEFVEMTSPREYNFTSDRLFAKVPIEQINKIRKEVEEHPEYADYIQERFEPRSGFIPFYENDSRHEDWTKEVLDECQYEVILDFWLEKISDEAEEDWQGWLMDDFRSNGGMDEIVNDAVEAIIKFQKEKK